MGAVSVSADGWLPVRAFVVLLLVSTADASAISRRAAALALATGCAAPRAAVADTSCGPAGRAVLDVKGVLAASDLERLETILGKLEKETGYRIRVLTRARNSAEWTQSRSDVRCALGVSAARGGIDPSAVIVTADRGIKGALENGASYLTFDIGDSVRLALPDIFWSRLQREYGKRSFVEARGEAASVVTSCELILSCLRNEEFCTGVPSAESSFF